MLYTIVQDANQFRSLVWNDVQITKLVGEADIEKRIDMWNSPRSYEGIFNEVLEVSFPALNKHEEKLSIPDISVFQGRLFLNSKAYLALEPLIKGDGEFLPVTYEQGEAYVFTPLHVAESIDGIDTKLSRKNEWGDLINLAFHEEKVKDWALFRCEYDVFMSLQCNQAVKEIIEEKKLTGIFFTNELGNIFSNQFDSGVRGRCL